MAPKCTYAGLIVGFDWRPKKESRIEGPLVTAARPACFDVPKLFLLFVEALGTELLTAAKTTLAKDIPDVEPKNRGSEVPWTDTMPMLETNRSSLSASFCVRSRALLADDADDVSTSRPSLWLDRSDA